ncbi:MAG: acyltransferase [Muribaculaceae bacterium]|nr:acyltransferase [Muribaculaceae bacterium]
MTSYYTENELASLGLKAYGKKVLISRKCSIYGANQISIGDNVRIDDFCILSGNITLGSNIHISAFVALYGANGIIFEDYTGISPRSTIYSAMDDFSGDYLIGPIHPVENTNVTGGQVIVKKYAHIGANCIVFPNLIIEEGSVIGAMSLVNRSTKPWTINMGIPINKNKLRSHKLLKLIY